MYFFIVIFLFFCLSSEITFKQTSFTHVPVGDQGRHDPVLLSALSVLSDKVRLLRHSPEMLTAVLNRLQSEFQSKVNCTNSPQNNLKLSALLKGTTAIELSQHLCGSEVRAWNSTRDFCITSPEATNLYHVGATLIGKRLKDFIHVRDTLHKK